MKNRSLIAFLTIVSSTFLFFYACQKELKENKNDLPANKNILQNVKSFIKTEVSQTAFASIDFEKSIIYNLKENTVAVRIPLKGKVDSTDFIMVASADRITWSGNYVSVIRNGSAPFFTAISIKTISFDSSRVEINGAVIQSRLASLAAPTINLGVPGSIWLSFLYSLQEQYPESFDNWYYPEGAPPPSGGGGGNSGNTLYYDPYIASNVIIDKQLTDSFPCVARILDTISSQGNLNQRAQLALNEIFNVGKKIHLSINVENTWTIDSADGDTHADSAWATTLPDGTEGLDFYATIRLNPWLLKNSTKEYIASTIIHEAFHAYIHFKFAQYAKHTPGVDSNVIKALFPIYWGVYGGQFTDGSIPTNSHNIMASNFIDKMASPLYGFTNNQMSSVMKDSIYHSLAWGGLNRTTVWRAKSDTCNIMAINAAARDTSLVNFTVGATCPPYYNFTHKSLNLKMPCQ